MSESSVNTILWLLILIFVSFWVATFCFLPFTIVSILVPCLPNLKGLSDLLLKGLLGWHFFGESFGFTWHPKDNGFNGEVYIGKVTTMANCFMSFLWLLVLIFISFFVSGLCFFVYSFFQCCIPCCECLVPFGDFLVKWISFPRFCAEKMLSGGK